MPKFHVWDYETSFTPAQAVFLIEGKNSDISSGDFECLAAGNVHPVILKRMRLGYEKTVSDYLCNINQSHEFLILKNELSSLMMDEIVKKYLSDAQKDAFEKWLCSAGAGFDLQIFSRQEIQCWLDREGLPSEYIFEKKDESEIALLAENVEAEPAGRWPWGDHHTKLLGHLDAAARMFWSKYDPAKPKTTAPKNAVVASWLVDVCGVSETAADAMASLLRADDLKVGPRKK
jgi:hypothetical protein